MKKPTILTIVMVGAAVAAVICATAIFYISADMRADETFDNNLAAQYATEATEPPERAADGAEGIDPPLTPSSSLRVDFEALRAYNEDTIGWVYQRDTKISYPVVQTTNNSLYLDKRFDGESTERGCIFADYRHDVSDSNVLILYGHNVSRRTQTQFSSLVFYLEDPDYIKTHPSFEFYDAATGECKTYDVFSVFMADVSTQESADRYYKDVSDDEYADYLSFIAGESIYDTGIVPTADQKTLIFSTCVTGRYEVRCLIVCIERAPRMDA